MSARLPTLPVLLAALTAVVVAAGPRRNLADATLEELADIEVTTAARKRQPLSKTAAAIYVITSDDIRRSGAATIPEALRIVPGLFVGRIDGSKWAISARGFPGRFSNKMLVLIDGRSVYNNFYAGVYWDQNDTLLEDVDRIEVIRGPGGTMWGANAVNGVINIITKSARDTQGTRAAMGTGNDNRGYGAFRRGGQAGRGVFYRGWAKYSNFGEMRSPAGRPFGDPWSSGRGGARLDWEANGRDTVTVHGDAYRGRAGQSIYVNYPFYDPQTWTSDSAGSSGGYALTRWERTHSERSGFALQGYFQSENRGEGLGRLRARTLDFEFQQQFALGSRGDLLWGGGYRRLENEIGRGPSQPRSYILPEKRIDGLASLFVQNDIALVRDRLVLSLGTKVQHNAYTGLEAQPNIRLLWTPAARHTLWAAGSRAVRTPVRLEHDLNLPFEFPAPLPPGTLGVLLGNRQFRSETAVSWEAGWRWQSKSRLSVDVATYLSQHRHLEVFRIGTPRIQTAPAPHLLVPIPWDNGLTVRNQGVELATTWKLRRRWSLQANYTWFREIDKRQTIPGATIQLHVTASPRHALQMQSSLGITPRLTLNLNAYAYSGVPERPVPGYFRPDANLTYRLGEQTEMSAGVQNLLDPRHREFIAEDYVHGAEIKRSVFVRLSWGS